MSMTMSVQKQYSLGGKQFMGTQSINGGTSQQNETSIAAAKVGALTTRTNNTDGVLTMNAGHGFVTSDKIDLYWTGGSRVNVACTVSGNAVTITGGTGDNLPAQDTAITAMKPTTIDLDFVGNNLYGLVFFCDVVGTVTFYNATTVLLKWTTPAASQVLGWTNQDVATNPLAGVTVTSATLSHGDSTAVRTARVGALTSA